MAVGVQSGETFLDGPTLLSQFNQLSQSQQDLFKTLAGKSIPAPSGNTFLSGAVLPNDPVQVYGLTQWKPPKVSTLLGGLVTTTQPEGYGFFQDLSILNEYYPRYLKQSSPISESVKGLTTVSNSYNQQMFGSFGNSYFNSIEKSTMQDKQAKMFQVISSAVISLAAWGSGFFLGPVDGGATIGATTGTSVGSTSTVSSTGVIDPTYFGFEGSTFQSLGVSEYSFGATQLSPAATASLTGASAFSGAGFFDKIGQSLSSFVKGAVTAKPIQDFVSYLTSTTGKIGEALSKALSGDFVGAGKVFGPGTTTPPSNPVNLFGNFQSGGGASGLGVGSGGTGQTTTNPLVFPAIALGLLAVLWLLMRKK